MDVQNKNRIKEDIELYNCHVIKVMEEDDLPGFGYSIGLFERFNHSEVIIVGLKLDLIHSLINSIAEGVSNGKRFESYTFYPDILDNFDCFVVDVANSNYDEYVGQALSYYGNRDFPLVQCIYPTVKGAYPWQDEWPKDINGLQPILGNVNF
jgi:Domain of unknown function (DUF4262)